MLYCCAMLGGLWLPPEPPYIEIKARLSGELSVTSTAKSGAIIYLAPQKFFPHDRVKKDGHGIHTAATAVHPRNRHAEGPHGRGCVEYARPRAGRARIYRRHPLAESRRVPGGARAGAGVPSAQMGLGFGLPVDLG